DGYLAINVGGKYLLGLPDAHNVILYNPFTIASETNRNVQANLIPQVSATEQLAEQLVAGALHELGHQKARGPPAELAGEPTRTRPRARPDHHRPPRPTRTGRLEARSGPSGAC